MKSSWKFGVAAVALIIGFLAYWYLAPREASFGMFEDAGTSGTARLGLSFAATVAGVILGSAYRRLRELQAQGARKIENIPAFVGDVFRSTDMWIGLVGSPLAYALLLKSSDGMSLPGLLTVALENGFCCLLIINGFLARTEQQQAVTADGKH